MTAADALQKARLSLNSVFADDVVRRAEEFCYRPCRILFNIDQRVAPECLERLVGGEYLEMEEAIARPWGFLIPVHHAGVAQYVLAPDLGPRRRLDDASPSGCSYRFHNGSGAFCFLAVRLYSSGACRASSTPPGHHRQFQFGV